MRVGINAADSKNGPIRCLRVQIDNLPVFSQRGLVIAAGQIIICLPVFRLGHEFLWAGATGDTQPDQDDTGNEKVNVLPVPNTLSAHT